MAEFHVSVRKVEAPDIPQVIDLMKNVYRELRGILKNEYLDAITAETTSPENLRGALEKADQIILAAESERIIDVISGRILPGGLAQIWWFGVQKDRRRKGVGSKLLEEFTSIAEKEGVHKIFLTTCPELEEAINLYRRFGFAEEGYLRDHQFHQDIKIYSRFLKI